MDKTEVGTIRYVLSVFTFIPIIGTLIAIILIPINIFSNKIGSNKIVGIASAGFIVSIGLAFLISSQLPKRNAVPIILKNGNNIILKSKGIAFGKGWKALKIDYQTQIPLDQINILRKEAKLVWELFKKEANESDYKNGVIMACEPPIKTGFFTKSTNAYTFVLKKNNEGEWAFITQP